MDSVAKRRSNRKRASPARLIPGIAISKEQNNVAGKSEGIQNSSQAARKKAKIKKESAPRISPSVKKMEKLKSEKKKVKSEEKPTTLARPTPEECRYATTALAALHPHVVAKNDERRATLLEGCGLRASITDAIVGTMLSQNTTDANSKAAFASLKKAFPGWDDVAACDDIEMIEDAIRVAGLAKTRAERIRAILRTVESERGQASLEYLRFMSDEDVKKELGRFKGLGPKTISCVMLFALGRTEFPVDTHVLRISKKLGWVPSNETREGAYEHLNAMVPYDVKMDLHCLLVTHGKHCHKCAANGRPQFPPEDGGKIKCPLVPNVLQRASCKEEEDNDCKEKMPSLFIKEEEGLVKEEESLLEKLETNIQTSIKMETEHKVKKEED